MVESRPPGFRKPESSQLRQARRTWNPGEELLGLEGKGKGGLDRMEALRRRIGG